MIENNTINQAFSEVYDVIMHMEEEMFNKIPKSFVKFVENGRDTRICIYYRLF